MPSCRIRRALVDEILADDVGETVGFGFDLSADRAAVGGAGRVAENLERLPVVQAEQPARNLADRVFAQVGGEIADAQSLRRIAAACMPEDGRLRRHEPGDLVSGGARDAQVHRRIHVADQMAEGGFGCPFAPGQRRFVGAIDDRLPTRRLRPVADEPQLVQILARGLGIFRLELERALEQRGRFLGLVVEREADRKTGQRFGIVGNQVERPPESGTRLFGVAFAPQRETEIAMRHGELRFEPHGLAQHRDRLVEPAELQQHRGEIGVREREVRLGGDRRAQMRDGGRRILAVHQQAAQIVLRGRRCRIDRDRGAIGLDRRLLVAARLLDQAARNPDLDIARFECAGLGQRRGGFLVAAEIAFGDAQQVIAGRIRAFRRHQRAAESRRGRRIAGLIGVDRLRQVGRCARGRRRRFLRRIRARLAGTRGAGPARLAIHAAAPMSSVVGFRPAQ